MSDSNCTAKRLADKFNSLIGRPSNLIGSIKDIPPDEPLIIVARVSYITQERNGNLDDSERNLKKEASHLNVIDCIRYTGSAKNTYWLREVVERAKPLDASILLESLSRLIRPPEYHYKRNPLIQAAEIELQLIRRILNGTKAYTVINPDATAEEERAYQSMRGKVEKDKVIGRPVGTRKDFKSKWIETVMRMTTDGMSLREIAEFISGKGSRTISYESIRKWIKGG